MTKNYIETLREMSVSDNIEKMANTFWPTWKKEINKLAPKMNAAQVLNLADHLREIFQSTNPKTMKKKASGREQGDLTNSGKAWELLICNYLNLCLIGTRAVAFKKKKKFMPEPFSNALTVKIGNWSEKSETDLGLIVFPDKPEFTSNLTEHVTISNDKIRLLRNKNKSIIQKKLIEYRDFLTDKYFNLFEFHNLQLKTNWNDVAQTPLLWDIIYRMSSIPQKNITVGINNYNISNLKSFTYSFVTVPSQKNISKYKSTRAEVNRVRNLLGGNYWGLPTKNGIASSLKEFFQSNISPEISGNLRVTLDKELKKLSTEYSYFEL
tara:strand:- start:611 stop:1579 length:969 start_codon:yes stop_codon:yes gene_type:complete